MALLVGQGLAKHFGGVRALDGVDFALEPGTITGLIGPNGAGKTTLFNLVAGAVRPTAGRVAFQGRDITGLPPNRICRMGIARTFQITRPFGDMTCLENVAVAVINRPDPPPGGRWEADALEALETVGLADRARLRAAQLNLIEKKKLELARALASRPKLLLLDEVLGGLNSAEIAQAVELIRSLRDQRGLTVFWIEHVMGAIMRAADRIIVLDQGKKLTEGPPESVVQDPRVVRAYLGGG